MMVKGFIGFLVFGMFLAAGFPHLTAEQTGASNKSIAIVFGEVGYAAISSGQQRDPEELAGELFMAWIQFELADLKTMWEVTQAIGRGDCSEAIVLLGQLSAKKVMGLVIPGSTIFWTDALLRYSSSRFRIGGSVDRAVAAFIRERRLDDLVCHGFTNVYHRIKANVDWKDWLSDPVGTYRVVRQILNDELTGLRSQFVSQMTPVLRRVQSAYVPSTPSNGSKSRGGTRTVYLVNTDNVKIVLRYDEDSNLSLNNTNSVDREETAPCTTIKESDGNVVFKACGPSSWVYALVLVGLAVIVSALGL